MFQLLKNRPIINIERDGFMKGIEAFAALCVVASWFIAIYFYGKLPSTIPIHFDGAGNANGFGAKESIFLLPCLATVIVFGIHQLSKHPHLFNYVKPVDNDNAEQLYRSSVKILYIVNAITSLILLLAVASTISAALDHGAKMSKWMMPMIIGLSVILVIYSIVAAVKSAKDK